ncbi:MAG: FxsA family protein [Sulfuricurvum sp.]|jgi:2-isopropylmalate synthase/UPF0716 protein FxsA|uniref:FxsA family protein n=1 Tax=Sulfuricurvum sp. TaxID=2025608 RepID=UPI0025FD1B9A|nr:FxsA family protein [Sulfuricurvum sp.]MCI4406217.1 FxsA family protein [Sulfuricurvum sp.]
MIYFLIYLFIEVLLTVEVASKIGGLAMFLEIIASAFLGIFILMNFRHALAENLDALRTRQIDMQGFSNRNITGLLGSLLLIVPGILSDLIGVLMLTFLLGTLLINHFTRKYPTEYTTQTPQKDDYVIDAEIIDDTRSLR